MQCAMYKKSNEYHSRKLYCLQFKYGEHVKELQIWIKNCVGDDDTHMVVL